MPEAGWRKFSPDELRLAKQWYNGCFRRFPPARWAQTLGDLSGPSWGLASRLAAARNMHF